MGSESGGGSFWARNRWALPLLLLVIIAVVVLGAVFGSKIKSATGSATATATPRSQSVVVTPTPGPGTPTAAAGTPGAATATPANGQGATTPLPNASPIPTEQGKTLGMITRNNAPTIQKNADSGASGYTFYLNPRQVVMNTLPDYGFPAGSFQIVDPASASPTPTPLTDQSGRPTIKFIVSYQSRKYQVSVSQPETRGPKGIWVIVTILPPGYY